MKGYIDKKHRDVTLEVLRKIKRSIETETRLHICSAALIIRRDDLTSKVSERDLDAVINGIRNYVSDSIGAGNSYWFWLEVKHGREITREEAKRGRLAWLDRMIQEVENA